MRIGKLPNSDWCSVSELNSVRPGSTTSTTNAMPASFQPSVCRKVSLLCTESQSTMLPRKPNSQTSASAIPAVISAETVMMGHEPLVQCRQNATSVLGGSTGSSGGNGLRRDSNQRYM